MSVADDLFAAQPSAFYVDGLKKLEQQSKKCVELRGSMLNKVCVLTCSSLPSLQSQRLVSTPSYWSQLHLFLLGIT
jgi:hypothetical protein